MGTTVTPTTFARATGCSRTSPGRVPGACADGGVPGDGHRGSRTGAGRSRSPASHRGRWSRSASPVIPPVRSRGFGVVVAGGGRLGWVGEWLGGCVCGRWTGYWPLGRACFRPRRARRGGVVVSRVAAAAAGASGLNVGVTGAGEHYRGNWRGVAALDAQTNCAAADGKAETSVGGAGRPVCARPRTQAAAIAPATGSPAGVKLLVSRMDERLAAMEREITPPRRKTGCWRPGCGNRRRLPDRRRTDGRHGRHDGGRGGAPAGLGSLGGLMVAGCPTSAG